MDSKSAAFDQSFNHYRVIRMPRLHETAKIGPIFAVRQILPGRPCHFCEHPTNGHHILQNMMER